jgi:hypothetical protein
MTSSHARSPGVIASTNSDHTLNGSESTVYVLYAIS